MRALQFNVCGQGLVREPDCDFRNLIAGTSGYLKLSFKFDTSWDETVKVAAFYPSGQSTEYAALIKDGCCMIPDEVAACIMFQFGVVGERKDGQRITTNLIRVMQEKGSGQSWLQ